MEAFLEQHGCERDATICIVSASLIAIITLVVIPFSIYYTLQIHRWRNDPGIIHRYPTTLILSSILNIFYMFIVIQYGLIDRGIYNTPTITLWFAPIIANPYLLIIILINIYRLWLINYDINHKIISSRESWQTKLCSTVNEDKWYSRNGQTWGSWRWLIKILLSIWFLLSILCIAPLFLNRLFSMDVHENMSDIIFTSIVIILLLFAIIITYKMPTFEDTHHILKELKILITSSVILCFLWFSLIFWSQEGNIFDIMRLLIIFLFVFMQIFVSEFMVMQMIRKIKQKDTKSNDGIGPIHFKVLFRIIMSVDFAIEQYANHLEDQWSQENFLFFIEALQWLYTVTDQEWNRFDIKPLHIDNIQYNFAKVIPTSSINKEDVHWCVKYDKLYKKYVSESSDYQVNLPHDQRVEFEHLLFLWDIKHQINQGVYEPKLVKKRQTQRDKSMISKSTSIKSKSKSITSRLRSLRRYKSAQKMKQPNAANVIEEEKISKPDHIRKSKSLQTYSKKTVDDFKPLHRPKSVDLAKHDANSIELHKKASHEVENPSNNFSLTITNTDENSSVRVLAKAPVIHKEKSSKSQDTQDLEDIYMGIIDDNDHEELPPSTKVMKSVSFAEALVHTTTDDEAAGHRKSGTVIEHIHNAQMNSGSDDYNSQTNSESFDEVLEANNRKLSDIKEEAAASPPKECKLDAKESKLDHFLAHVHEGIDTEKKIEGIDFNFTPLDKKTTSHDSNHSTHSLGVNLLSFSDSLTEPVPMDADENKLTATISTVSTMETGEWATKQDMHLGAHRRKGKSGMSSFIGLGLSRLGTLLTPRSTSKRLSEFVDDETAQSIWEIDPVEKRNMRDAEELNVQHFVTVLCEAVSAVLRLNRDLVARFKSTKYWEILKDNVDLEQLVKEYQQDEEDTK